MDCQSGSRSSAAIRTTGAFCRSRTRSSRLEARSLGPQNVTQGFSPAMEREALAERLPHRASAAEAIDLARAEPGLTQHDVGMLAQHRRAPGRVWRRAAQLDR